MRLASRAISVLHLGCAAFEARPAADQKAAAALPLPSSTRYRRRPRKRASKTAPRMPSRLYRQAVKLRPAWAEGWWFLGELLYDRSQYPGARDALRRLIDLDHNSSAGFALLGLCEFETKEDDKSLNHIYQARRLGLGDDPQVRRVVLFHEMLLLAAPTIRVRDASASKCRQGWRRWRICD